MSSFVHSNLYDLSGRIALVTGGGTGIGLSIARGLGAAGAKVYIGGRRKEVLDKIVNSWDTQHHGQAVALQLDVTDKASISAAHERIAQDEGKLHILVNNAGQEGPTSPFLNDPSAPEHADAETLGKALFDAEDIPGWGSLFMINTAALYFVTVRFLGLLAKGSADVPTWTSSVINITSISGLIKIAQRHFCYNASKAAADHLTLTLSTEFALKNVPIRVNSIAPGVYASEMTFANIDTPEAVARVAQSLHPVPAGRVGSPEEVAGTAVYFASRAGGYATGQIIAIDGGYTAVNPSRV